MTHHLNLLFLNAVQRILEVFPTHCTKNETNKKIVPVFLCSKETHRWDIGSSYVDACRKSPISKFMMNVSEVCGWITVVLHHGDLWGGCI